MVKTSYESPQNYNRTNLSPEELDVCPGELEIQPPTKHNGEFDWDEEMQGYVLSASAYGVLATHMVGGRLSEIVGPKYVLGLGLLLTGLLTMLCPAAAEWSFGAFITVRVIIGITSGVIMPAVNVLVARWYPVEERQLILSAIMASAPLATVIALSTSGIVANDAGWPAVFYLFGFLPVFWFIPWLFLAYDSPEKHPRISEKEKNTILKSLGQQSQTPQTVPWIAILTSLPLWAYIIMTLGYSWIGSTLISQLPTYLSRILHFDLQKSGVVSALPFIFAPIGGVFFGLSAMKIRKSGRFSYLSSIRLFNSISAIGSSVFIFVITLVGCDATAITVLLILSMVAVAAYCGGSITNHLDLGSNFAGTTSGITSTVSGVSAIISPLIVGALTNDNQTLTQWHIVFYIAICFTIFCYGFFMIFGSVEEQAWNKIGTDNNEPCKQENISKKMEQV
ncbi:hypothetical protein L9F63_002018 [Diploptera punctata]|uniref:Major facilitator superfamily (MFS) profile domain-containing protein n=1 Tax=Diploptera punctata TaxID=6984 RepID=A0AAD8A2T9_DIPPU|nr:hypothetical protein L9F63_002018 [Diploptera punctata]